MRQITTPQPAYILTGRHSPAHRAYGKSLCKLEGVFVRERTFEHAPSVLDSDLIQLHCGRRVRAADKTSIFQMDCTIRFGRWRRVGNGTYIAKRFEYGKKTLHKCNYSDTLFSVELNSNIILFNYYNLDIL